MTAETGGGAFAHLSATEAAQKYLDSLPHAPCTYAPGHPARVIHGLMAEDAEISDLQAEASAAQDDADETGAALEQLEDCVHELADELLDAVEEAEDWRSGTHEERLASLAAEVRRIQKKMREVA